MPKATPLKASKENNSERANEKTTEQDRGAVSSGLEAEMLNLHRTLGNRAFGEIIQGKERGSKSGEAVIQRKCNCGGTCEHCKEEKRLQRKELSASGSTPKPGNVPHAVQAALAGGGGSALDGTLHSTMKSRFNRDFSQVRIHTDAAANRAAESINAAAFTVGNSIWFGPGQFQPRTDRGVHLLAHELAHTIQQGDHNFSLQRSLGIGSAGDPAEAAADRAANAVLQNAAVPALGSARPMLRRREQAIDPATVARAAVPVISNTEDPNVVTAEFNSNVYRVRRRVTGWREVRETVETNEPARLRADMDRSNAWLQVEWCTVGARSTRGRIRFGADIPAALQQTISGMVFGGQDPRTAIRNLDITPFVEVDITRSEQVRVRGRAETTVQPSTGDVQRGRGSIGIQVPGATIDFNLEVTPGQGPGGQTGVTGGVTLTLPLPGEPRPQRVECRRTEIVRYIPQYALACVQRIPEQPVSREQERFLYFEYSTDTIATHNSSTGRSRRAENERAAAQNDQEISRLQQLIDEGWQVSSIRGYTSPEGPRQQGREGGFIGNQKLSENRASAARRYLEGLCNPGGALSMRRRTCLVPNAPVTGEGELLTADEPGTGRELEGTELATQATPRFLGSEEEATRRTPELEQQLATARPRQQASLIYPLLRRAKITFTKQETTPAREQALEACPPAVERAAREFLDNRPSGTR